MKKINQICLWLMIIFSSLVVINIFQSKDVIRVSHIEETPYTKKFYINHSNLDSQYWLDSLQKIADQQQVSFFITTDDAKGAIIKATIFEPHSFPYTNFNLKKAPLFPNQNDFYASFKSNSKSKKGEIPIFFKQNKIKLETMAVYFSHHDLAINGTYTVVGTKQTNLNLVLKKISQITNISMLDLIKPTESSATTFLNRNLIFISIGMVIVLMLFILNIISQSLSNIPKIGVLKLNGFSNLTIFWQLIKKDLSHIFACIFVTNFVLWCWLTYWPKNLLFFLLLIQFSMILLYLLISSITYLTIRKVKISQLLTNYYDTHLSILLVYLLKGFVSITIIFLLMTISTSLEGVLDQYQQNKTWRPYQDTLTLASVNNGDNEETLKKLVAIYPVLENKLAMQHIRNQNISKSDYPKYQALFKQQGSLNIMTVNLNYLQQYFKSKKLLGLINNSSTRFYLVPKSLKPQATMLRQIIMDQTSDDTFALTRLKGIPKENKVKFLYYQQKLAVFNYDIEQSSTIRQPVYSVITPKSMTDYEAESLSMNGAAQNPLKIKNTSENRRKLGILTQSKSFKAYQIKFLTLRSIMTTNFNEVKNFFQILLLILVAIFIIDVVTVIFLAQIVFQHKIQLLAVQKLLGFTLFRRYRQEIFVLTTMNFIELITISIYSRSIYLIGLTVFLILFEFVILYLFINTFERKQLISLLKGEN